MRNIKQTFEHRIKDQDVKFEVSNLPKYVGDYELLHQAFSNLIDNSLKFLSPYRKGRISISGQVIEHSNIYCAGDNGIGITPEHQKQIFLIFHRLHSDGEGLGLAIVSQVLNRPEGKIWVESEPGIGSKFHVSLPNR